LSARMNHHTVLWIYIVFLVVGGLIGFLKGKSKISLNMSLGFAIALVVCNIKLLEPGLAVTIANILMVILLVVFGMRLAKTKKFMPAGMMLVVTMAALVLSNI